MIWCFCFAVGVLRRAMISDDSIELALLFCACSVMRQPISFRLTTFFQALFARTSVDALFS
jgi:hypothetical protein